MAQRPAPKVRSRAPKKKRSGRVVRYALVFVTSVVLVDALFGDQGLLATVRARREYNALAGDLAHLRAENAQLRERARRLREDPTTIEEIARRDLGFIREGETLFIIKELPPADAPDGLPPAPELP